MGFLRELPTFAWDQYDQAILEDNHLKSVDAEKIKIITKEVLKDIQEVKDIDTDLLKTLKQRVNKLLDSEELGIFSKKFIITSLFHICYSHLSLMDQLVTQQEILNIKNGEGETILHLAAKNQEKDLVSALINGGANPNVQSEKGFSPLHYTICMGTINFDFITIVEKLLAAGADINIQDKEGDTPLQIALINKLDDIAKYFISKGADCTLINSYGVSISELAVNNGCYMTIQALLEKGCDPNTKNQINGQSLLFNAAFQGRLTIVQLLLDKGARWEESCYQGFNALHIACNYGQVKIAEMLLTHGADPNKPSLKKNHPLSYAINSGKIEMVKLLLRHGAKVNSVDSSGSTPYSIAQGSGYKEIEKLLQIGLDDQHRAFLNHKLMNHYFGLSIITGMSEDDEQKIKLTSFQVGNTYPPILKSFERAKKWLEKAPSTWNEEDTASIIRSLTLSCETLDNRSGTLESNVESLLESYYKGEAVVIPTGSEGHANVIVLWQNYLFKGDRTIAISMKDASLLIPGLLIYKINAKDQLKEAITKLISERNSSKNKGFFISGIDKFLELEVFNRSIHLRQHGDNCCFNSSAKLAVECLLLARLFQKGMNFEEADPYSKAMYHSFIQEDHLPIETEEYIQQVPESYIKTTVLACIYKHRENKKIRKQQAQPDPIMEMIEQKAPEAKALSTRVKISESWKRIAQII